MLVSSFQLEVVEFKSLLRVVASSLLSVPACYRSPSITASASDKASQPIRRACATPTKRGRSDLSRLAILSHLYNLFMIIVSSCDIIRFRVMQYLSRYLHSYRFRALTFSLQCRN